MLIAIDDGNGMIKTENACFPVGLNVHDTVPYFYGPEDYFKKDGMVYIPVSKNDPPMFNKTLDNRYLNLTFMAVAKELDRMVSTGKIPYQKGVTYKVSYLIGLPPKNFLNRELKDDWRKYLDHGPVEVEYNGRTWKWEPDGIKIYAQCHGAMVTIIKDIYKYDTVWGIDIGAGTIDTLCMKHGVLVPDSAGTFKLGIKKLYSKILQDLESRFDVQFSNENVDSIIAGEANTVRPEIIKAVEEHTQAFVIEALRTIQNGGVDLQDAFIVFCGGGALRFRKYIEASGMVRNYTFIEDIHANAKGYKLIYLASKKGNK